MSSVAGAGLCAFKRVTPDLHAAFVHAGHIRATTERFSPDLKWTTSYLSSRPFQLTFLQIGGDRSVVFVHQHSYFSTGTF